MQKTEEFMAYAAERYMLYISYLDSRVNVALAAVASARSKLDIAGVNYESYSSGCSSDSLIPDGLARIEETLHKAEAELAEYNDEAEKAKEAIQHIDNEVFRDVLKCRYIFRLDWCHTAKAIGYSESHAKSFRVPALIALYPHIPEEWKRNLPNAQVQYRTISNVGVAYV